MFPPHVSDSQIRTLIRELGEGASKFPSGLAVRAELKARFGFRCGVRRVYRLISEERSRTVPQAPVTDVSRVEAELKAMRERAERAEEREDAHQLRWAAEIDRLRLKVSELEVIGSKARPALAENELLRRRLQVAEGRIAALEQALSEVEDRGN